MKTKTCSKFPQARTAQIPPRWKPPVNPLSAGAGAGVPAAGFKKWKDAGHGHAVNTLEKVAAPSLRHPTANACSATGGFHHQTGYQEHEAPQLRDVGCELPRPRQWARRGPEKELLDRFRREAGRSGAWRSLRLAFMEKMAKTDPFERGKDRSPGAAAGHQRGVEIC